MQRPLRSDRGLTLVETLVTVAILASIAGVLVSFQWVTLNQWRSSDTQLELQQSVRIALGRMARVARMAGEITLEGASGNKVKQYGYLETPPKGDKPVAKNSQFYINGANLKENITSSGTGSTEVAQHIKSIIQTWDGRSVYLEVTGSMDDGQEYTLRTRVTPRRSVSVKVAS